MSFLKGLIDKLDPKAQGTAVDPNAPTGVDVAGPRSDNTGIAGNITPTLDRPMAAPAAQPFVRNNTRLMEGDAGKLADPTKGARSPKYDFLQLANQGKYGYDQVGDMLKELQGGANAGQWQGWTADRDKLRYTGDLAKLAPQWNGVTSVDVVGGYNSGNPQGFRWGADDPNAALSGGMPGHAGGVSPVLAGQNAGLNIQNALGKFGQPSDMIQQLIAKLQGAA